METWKQILECPKYEVSNLGNIRHIKTGKLRKVTTESKLYDYIGLENTHGKIKQYRIHRLVALAFINNPENFPIVNHIDGNKNNNKASNLEWCNYSYNTLHAYKNGLIKQKTILDEKAIECIRYLIHNGFSSQRDLAKALNLSYTTIQNYCK